MLPADLNPAVGFDLCMSVYCLARARSLLWPRSQIQTIIYSQQSRFCICPYLFVILIFLGCAP